MTAQMVRMLELMEELMQARSYAYQRLDGNTPSAVRQVHHDSLQLSGHSCSLVVVLFSPRAGL